MNPGSRDQIRRLAATAYVVALGVCLAVAAVVGVLIVATVGIETVDPPLNPGLFVAFGVSALVGLAAGMAWVLFAERGRRRALALPGVLLSVFLWWSLLIYGSTNGFGVTSTDAVSVMATRPAYLLWLVVGLLLVGLPMVAKRRMPASGPQTAEAP